MLTLAARTDAKDRGGGGVALADVSGEKVIVAARSRAAAAAAAQEAKAQERTGRPATTSGAESSAWGAGSSQLPPSMNRRWECQHNKEDAVHMLLNDVLILDFDDSSVALNPSD